MIVLWEAYRLIDLWKWRSEDIALATNGGPPYWLMAREKEGAIERKLAETPLEYRQTGTEHHFDIGLDLCFGVPDSDRVYGSAYLARHPEMQEARPSWDLGGVEQWRRDMETIPDEPGWISDTELAFERGYEGDL